MSQEYDTFVQVLKMALGESEKDSVSKPQSFADAEAQFKNLFGS